MATEDIGALVVRIEADLKDFKKNMNNALDILKETQKRSSGLSTAIKNAFSFAGGFAIFKIIESGFKNSVKAGFDFNRTMQQNTIAFESMLGSAEKTKVLLKKLTDMAAKTPFEFPELATAAKKMLAFGFEAEKIPNIMKNIGDASAGLGLGAEGVSRITTALGQMQAKQKVQAQELLQLTEAGIPALDILAKHFGKTTAEISQMQEKGLIPAEEAIDALIKGMGERFPDMMAKQSKSFDGLMSTVRDNIQITFGKILEPAFDNLTNKILPNTIARLEGFTKTLGREGLGSAVFSLTAEFKELSSVLTGVASSIIAFKVISTISSLMETWKVITKEMTIVQAAFNVVMEANPIMLVAAAIGTLVAAISFNILKTRQAIDELKNEMIKDFEEERDAAIRAIDEQHKTRLDVLNNELVEEKNVHNERLNQIKDEYNNEIESLNKRESALKENLSGRKSLLENQHRNAIDKIREEFGVFEEKTKSRTDLVREQYDNEIKAATEAHNEKIKLIDEEYAARFKLLDEETRKQIKELENQIYAVDEQTKEEEKIAKEQRNKEKIRELESKIAAETDADKKLELRKRLKDLLDEISREQILAERELEKQALRDRIGDIKTNAEEKKKSLEEELNNEKIKLKQSLEEEKIDLAAKRDVAISVIQEERIAKEIAENEKYLATKKSLDDEEIALENFKENYKIKLDEQLKLKQKQEEDKFKATQDRINKEIEAEQKLIDEQKKIIEQQAEESIKMAEEKAKEKFKQIQEKQANEIAQKLGEAFAPLTPPGFANGVQNFSGGAAIVGEKGRELVTLPRGSNVIPNKQTESILGQTINYEGMFNGAMFNVRSDNDIKMIAREIYNLQQSKGRGSGVIA